MIAETVEEVLQEGSNADDVLLVKQDVPKRITSHIIKPKQAVKQRKLSVIPLLQQHEDATGTA